METIMETIMDTIMKDVKLLNTLFEDINGSNNTNKPNKTEFEKMLNEIAAKINADLEDDKKFKDCNKLEAKGNYIGIWNSDSRTIFIGYTFGLKIPDYALSLAVYGGSTVKQHGGSITKTDPPIKYAVYSEFDEDDKWWYYFKIDTTWTIDQAATYCADIIRDVVKSPPPPSK